MEQEHTRKFYYQDLAISDVLMNHICSKIYTLVGCVIMKLLLAT